MVNVTVENEENDKYDLRLEFPVILFFPNEFIFITTDVLHTVCEKAKNWELFSQIKIRKESPNRLSFPSNF